MSKLFDRTSAEIIPIAGFAVVARRMIGCVVAFGGYTPDDTNRDINKGNAFGNIFSNTFGNAR